MKKLLTTLATVMFVTLASAHEGKQELRGRDIVRTGKTSTLTGALSTEGDEWRVTVGETVYNLHLGPSFYRDEKGIELKEGAAASITGFLNGVDMAPATIRVGENTYVLRDENGRPAWAGRGRSGGGGKGRAEKEACTKDTSEACAKTEKPVAAE